MSKQAIATLKSYFGLGAKPTSQNFYDVLDSYVHLDNQAAVDSQIVDTKIAAYDNSQRSRPSKGVISTFGDVLAFVRGISDTAILTDLLGKLTTAATWAQLPGKPASVALAWTEQTIDTSGIVSPPLNQSAQAWLCSSQAFLLNKKYVIFDIQITRTAFSPSAGVVVSCDEITAVKIGITPNTSFS